MLIHLSRLKKRCLSPTQSVERYFWCCVGLRPSVKLFLIGTMILWTTTPMLLNNYKFLQEDPSITFGGTLNWDELPILKSITLLIIFQWFSPHIIHFVWIEFHQKMSGLLQKMVSNLNKKESKLGNRFQTLMNRCFWFETISVALWYFRAHKSTKCTLKRFEFYQHNIQIWLMFTNDNTPSNTNKVL